MSDDIKQMTEEVQGRVRQLAYLMWESAGRQHGMAMKYWLEAEREVLTAMHAATETMIAAAQPPTRGKRQAEAKETPQQLPEGGDGEKDAAQKVAAPAKKRSPARSTTRTKQATGHSGTTAAKGDTDRAKSKAAPARSSAGRKKTAK